MKEKKLKNIRVCCYVALAFCLVWSVLIASNFIVTFAGSYASAHPIDWSVNAAMKIIVLTCHVLGSVALITMCTIAVFIPRCQSASGSRPRRQHSNGTARFLCWNT